MPGEGEYGGDLTVDVSLKSHRFYDVDWPDLHLDVSIMFYQAILGDCLEIDTLKGSAFFNIKPGTKHEDTMILKGYGLRKVDKNKKVTSGDLHIKLLVEIPKRINKKQRALLEEYKELDRNKQKIKPKTK